METYKTYKGTENGTVGAFENQFGNVTVEITFSKTYSLEYFDDETEEERINDFLSEYGRTEETEKAINFINNFIKSNF